ncbi:glycosyl hydrolase family 65 central catalytic domain-containing protein [Tricharina praecox]|uniref:glycosyl hydrolase family 65 central catalytic domain-containing protein n=1 Tax=Tricharina praecox TaxID=43433 RepID=UPI00221F1604|nr:glycosyl hydrolase family 65 central catalytic domain-containing protein [Tricharina praecox]KAI5843591.1 glycosyl hydrolase family 65 central catalytic domain-containing protein [Tricharina praecox]
MARLLLLAPAVLLVFLATLAWSMPAFPLEERQLGAPPINDFRNVSRPANMAEYDPDTWTLGTHSLVQNEWQVQPYVANGYHGSRLTAEGLGYWRIHNVTGDTWPINGWPLDNPRQTFATIAGFWDSQRNTTRTNFPELLRKGGESVISGIPTWTSFVIATADGKHTYGPGVDQKTVEYYHQTLSLKDGIVTTAVKWRPVEDGPVYDLGFTVLAHRGRLNLGMMKIDIVSSDGSQLIVTDVLDGQGAQRTDAAGKAVEKNDDLIWTAVHPDGISNVTAYEFSTLDFAYGARASVVKGSRRNAEARPWVTRNDSTIAQEYTVEPRKGQTMTILKYVGIASTDAFPDPKKTARDAAFAAKKTGWKKLLAEHRACWEALWEDADIEIPGKELEELQISVRASLFHLLSNVRSETEGEGIGDNSISVGGLSSDSYAGLVFWDAELWMLPGLLVLHPEHAASINNYRTKMLPQARENAKEYGLEGALYPWTSSRYGNCTGTGPCADYQYHLNTDIALVHWHQFLTTGDMDWFREKGWPVIEAVAQMWSGLVDKALTDDADGLKKGMYTVNNMTDPDEYANHIDNGAFTTSGVKVIMGIAQQAAAIMGLNTPPKWADVETNMFIPYNTEAQIIPEYAQMNGSVEIKQADVVLINYPLEFRLNESQALNDLDFYARAQSPDGPAMTWAIFAISALDLSPRGCASWTYFLYASQPYLREPYYQFSEQILDDIYANGNTNPAFPFLTGHGGFLQIPTHGFTGYRPRLDAFYLDPSVPPQLEEGVTIKGMKHHGASFNVRVTPENTTITRRRITTRKQPSGPVTVRIGSRNSMGGDYPLLPGESLVVPTRRPDLNGTDIPGNKAECKLATTLDAYVPGQFPIGAVDGSNHTQWRPHSAAPADLTVDLGALTDINAISLNWAKWPPIRWALFASNDTAQEKVWQMVFKADTVEISAPWRAEDALKVVMQTGNTTVVQLEEGQRKKARYVKLTIEGDRSGEGHGGTVAQLGIL